MTPPIGSSVRRVTPDRWKFGSSKVCGRVTTSSPPNVIISWQDGDDTFYIREQVEEDNLFLEDGLESGLVHEGGTSAAVWTIGSHAFCKVKAWCEGLETESDTIHFVGTKVPCVPLPKVIYSWIDHKWNRSFLVLKRVDGQPLRDAWPHLSLLQRSEIASQVAKYCSKLAEVTSIAFESATHRGVLEPFFTLPAEPSHPSWKPRPLGPLLLSDFTIHLSRQSTTQRVNIGSYLHFYHADLGPGNVIISNEGHVEGIIDWESAGFYPRFWIATKPKLSAGFFLKSDEGTKRGEWRDLLGRMLKCEGFESAIFT